MKKKIKNDEEPKILLFDIETAPNLAYVWGKWEQNVIAFQKEWYMISFSWKWLGEKKTSVKSLINYSNFRKDKTDDSALVKDLWKLFNQADIIIAHNGDQFDIRKSNARFAYHKLLPPSTYKTIDTKKVAKRYFNFNSNKLDDLGQLFGLGEKLDTGGFDLWLGCMSGDKKSWKKMCDYNIQDVVLLEKVYNVMLPWMVNHPNLGLYGTHSHVCPNCASPLVHKRGYGINAKTRYERINCQSCGAWFKGGTIKLVLNKE